MEAALAIIACHDCGNEVSTEAKACPKCGAKVKAPTSGSTWLVAGIAGFLMISFFIWVAGQKSDPEEDRARMTYRACMDDLAAADRARDHARSRIVAQMCERFRQDFTSKYRHAP